MDYYIFVVLATVVISVIGSVVMVGVALLLTEDE